MGPGAGAPLRGGQIEGAPHSWFRGGRQNGSARGSHRAALHRGGQHVRAQRPRGGGGGRGALGIVAGTTGPVLVQLDEGAGHSPARRVQVRRIVRQRGDGHAVGRHHPHGPRVLDGQQSRGATQAPEQGEDAAFVGDGVVPVQQRGHAPLLDVRHRLAARLDPVDDVAAGLRVHGDRPVQDCSGVDDPCGDAAYQQSRDGGRDQLVPPSSCSSAAAISSSAAR